MKNPSPVTHLKALFRQWNKTKYIRHSGQLLILAIIVGLIGGVGAVVFHIALDWGKEAVLGNISSFSDIKNHKIPFWLFFLLPALGGLVSGILVYSLAPETAGHGTDAMIDNFHNRGGMVRKRVPFVKAIASLFTISSGGSAGYEGPTAQIGSGFGSMVSTLTRIPLKMRRLIMLSGTAAGLGAIFRAPLGGALTSVEVIYKEDFESEGFLPCIVASVVAYATFTQITQISGAIFNIPDIQFTHPTELLFFGLLGVLCAPVSYVYVKFFYGVSTYFQNIKIPNHFKPAIGGLGVGLIAYLCPMAIGGGWEHLQSAIQGKLAISILIWVTACKIITTSLTVGSGGSGGVFGPSLFIGGMLGGFFGFGVDALFPSLISNPSAYVLVGMGSFFAGVANAPIASIVMVCEITGNYNLLAPLMFASVLHLTLSRKWSIYKNQIDNKFDSPVHKEKLNTDILESILVKEVFVHQKDPITVNSDQNLNDLQKIWKESDNEVFPVLDQQGALAGLISENQIRKVILDTQSYNLVIAEDMMTKLYTLSEELDLHHASQLFLISKQQELPVVDAQMKILGFLKYQDILQAYDNIL